MAGIVLSMATKHITDLQVCAAYAEYNSSPRREVWPYDILHKITGQPEKVCYCAMQRAEARGFVEYGVSLRTGWLTPKGKSLLESNSGQK